MTKRSVSNDNFRQGRPKQRDGDNHSSSGLIFKGCTAGTSQTSDLQGNEVNNTNAPEDAAQSITPSSTCASQEGLLNALKDETDNLLRTPMTPIPSDLVSNDSFPLGVEKAKIEYGQGLLSTGTLFRDCLPPTLSYPRAGSSPIADRGLHGPFTAQPTASGTLLSVANQLKHEDIDGLSPVFRQRSLPRDVQLRRINQTPLSAIYEESDPSAGTQSGCPCNVCKDMPGRIIWFHLCPRYKAMAQENGIQYERYHGRVIVHNGDDRSSIGLIIEGPMEDRFVPAVGPPPVELSTPQKVRAPRPRKLDLRSKHTAAGRITKAPFQTTDSPKATLVETPALKRPISPTRVSGPSSLNPLSTVYCPKSAKSQPSPTDTKSKDATEPSCSGVIDSEEDIHPAFRVRGAQLKEWTTPPTRSQSWASLRNDSPQPLRSVPSGRARPSLSSSQVSGEHPGSKDSVGAPTHLGQVKPSDDHQGDQHIKLQPKLQHHLARQIADFAGPEPLLSPSAGPEQTPSEYLCPSTPSAASCNRSSASSYGGNQPQHVAQAMEGVAPAAAQEAKPAEAFRSSEVVTKNTNPPQNPSPFSQESSYYTAQGSQRGPSPAQPMPLRVCTASSSTEHLRSNIPRQYAPYFQRREYYRSQTSKQSTVQSSNSLRLQRASDLISGTTLLNGTAFDSTDETSNVEAEDAVHGSTEHDRSHSSDVHREGNSINATDPLLTTGAAEARPTNIINSSTNLYNADSNPPQTSVASEAQCTDIAASTPNSQQASRRASAPGSFTSSRINNVCSPVAKIGNNRPNSCPNDLDSHLSSSLPSSNSSSQVPPSRSLNVQHNLVSHTKLHDVLGVETVPRPPPPPPPRASPAFPTSNTKLQAMGMLDALAADGKLARKKEGGVRRVVKKGSRRFREGFVGRVRAGWRVPRQEEWLDGDDGGD